MDLDNLPSQGRIGLALSGPFEGQIVFVYFDPAGRQNPHYGVFEGAWGWWTSRGADDMLSRESVEENLRETDFYWFGNPEESLLESAIFALRPLGDQKAARRRRWGRSEP